MHFTSKGRPLIIFIIKFNIFSALTKTNIVRCRRLTCPPHDTVLVLFEKYTFNYFSFQTFFISLSGQHQQQ